MKAKVAHFYGWTDHYIECLSYNTFLRYYKSISIIESQKALLDLNVSMFPHLKKQHDRSRIIRELKKQGFQMIDKGEAVLKSYREVVANIARKLHG